MGVRVRPKSGIARTMYDLRMWIRDTIPGTARRLPYGERSEHLAARHLRWRGYRIIARNFKAAGAEIDIIVKDRDTIVFVEVKARMSDVLRVAGAGRRCAETVSHPQGGGDFCEPASK